MCGELALGCAIPPKRSLDGAAIFVLGDLGELGVVVSLSLSDRNHMQRRDTDVSMVPLEVLRGNVMRIEMIAPACLLLLTAVGCARTSIPDTLCHTKVVKVYVSPGGAVIDPPPNNQFTFWAFGAHDTSSGCVDFDTSPLTNVTWNTSAPASISFTGVPGATNQITVTCMAATSGPETISATIIVDGSPLTGTGTVTCK